MKVRVIILQDEDGVFVAECSTLPGCVSQGKTRAQARKNIAEAIEGYIGSLKKHKEPIPPSLYEASVEVGASEHWEHPKIAQLRDIAGSRFHETT